MCAPDLDQDANVMPEYIGHLEGELAAKSAEADELRAKNEKLEEENGQLNKVCVFIKSTTVCPNWKPPLIETP